MKRSRKVAFIVGSVLAGTLAMAAADTGSAIVTQTAFDASIATHRDADGDVVKVLTLHDVAPQSALVKTNCSKHCATTVATHKITEAMQKLTAKNAQLDAELIAVAKNDKGMTRGLKSR